VRRSPERRTAVLRPTQEPGEETAALVDIRPQVACGLLVKPQFHHVSQLHRGGKSPLANGVGVQHLSIPQARMPIQDKPEDQEGLTVIYQSVCYARVRHVFISAIRPVSLRID
jgi:hypothetical protein